ncbi:MAG TPA: penicillin acylase family protein, partial [Thermoanaerobaculia bacterium]|nr:penicillin acylase family protein [Thermoanaerobaculia bacterium]
MRRTLAIAVLVGVNVTLALSSAAQEPSGLIKFPGMRLGGTVTRDAYGIPSVFGLSRWDLFFLQGYVHAEDRFFQMDVGRRTAKGTLAELVGSAALPQDVQLRTLGFGRAADATYPRLADETREALVAYAAGVNAYLASNSLPPEYKALELTTAAQWQPTDTIAFAKLFAWNLSFDLDTTPTVTLLTYQAAGQILGVDGTKLFFEDLFRSAPFDPFTTIAPPAAKRPEGEAPAPLEDVTTEAEKESFYQQVSREADAMLKDGTLEALLAYQDKIKDLPAFQSVLRMEHEGSSNEWAIAGKLTTTGNPIVCNDPHLSLTTPAIWYPIALRGPGFNVSGNSVAGAPFVILGENDHLAWGATVHPMDVTDTFKETVVPDATSVVGYSIMYNGKKEPLSATPETFRRNVVGNGTNDDVVVVPASGSIPPA